MARFQYVPLEDAPVRPLSIVAPDVPRPASAPHAMEHAQRAAIVRAWTRTLALRDKETEDHTRRVTRASVSLARRLGIAGEPLRHLRWGALLHDVGKIGVPDRILHKAGPLTAGEWEIMRRHPEHAVRLLGVFEFLRPALTIPHCHHERWDGSGYPRGLRGTAIPIAARIFAAVDVYDALRSSRPYRQGWPRERALAYLDENAGRLFEPRVVDAFLSLEGAPAVP